jgi:hypothetical protein
MNDGQIANKIKEALSLDRSGSIDVSIQEFGRAWFAGKRISDKEFTKKMLNFTKKYELKYLVVLNRGRPVAVRFWQIKLLEDKNV